MVKVVVNRSGIGIPGWDDCSRSDARLVADAQKNGEYTVVDVPDGVLWEVFVTAAGIESIRWTGGVK
jgi:hypothetical protein